MQSNERIRTCTKNRWQMHTVMMEHMGSLGVTLNPFQESPWGAGGAEGEDFNTLSLPACPLPYLSFFFPSSVYMMTKPLPSYIRSYNLLPLLLFIEPFFLNLLKELFISSASTIPLSLLSFLCPFYLDFPPSLYY